MSLTGTLGSTYRIYVSAENSVGPVDSDSIAVILAGVPGTPSAPTKVSNGTYLNVIMTAPTSTGGAIIVSYELQIKFNDIEGWVSVIGGGSTHNLDLIYTV
jgi:hypothetical protein